MTDVAGNRSGVFRHLPDVWRLTVDAAQSEKDLVVAVRDYLATWQPDELSQLPESCRPGRITSGEDIADMAFRLSQVRLGFEGAQDRREMLDRMTGFFLHASERFGAILVANRDPFTEIDS
jgi:hypothetical protein